MTKRVLCILLSCCLLVTLFSGCLSTPKKGTAANSQTYPAQDEAPISGEAAIEIQTAIGHGLVAAELQGDYQKAIQYDQFCAMMTEVIRKLYGEGKYLDKWLEDTQKASVLTNPMTRGQGAEVIFVAALATEMDDYHSSAYTQTDIDGNTRGAALSGIGNRADLFPFLAGNIYNPNWGSEGNGFHIASMYPAHRTSAVSHKTIMEYDPDTLSMRYADPFTRAEAICAALRCYEGWVRREYVTTDDPQATAYDTAIITKELLEKDSSLPEVSHDKLPGDWAGFFNFSKSTTMLAMADSFHERDLRFIHENGMNFLRVPLSFTSLRYPDFPEDGNQVNLAELRDLDQLIAWAMEYDVHLSLGMLVPPGLEEGVCAQYMSANDGNWPDQKQWDLIHDYWIMLAKHYEGIPSKNLTFELCAEWGTQQQVLLENFALQWERIVAGIRSVSPDRVLMVSFDTANSVKLPMAEIMAKMGVSIATHPYYPGFFHYFGVKMRQAMGFTQELQWPMVWFPTEDFNENYAPIRISGEIGGITLSACVDTNRIWHTENGEPTLIVTADGKEIGRHTFTVGGANDIGRIAIPEGTKEVILTHTGHFWLNHLTAEGEFGMSQIPTTDGVLSFTKGDVNLTLNSDGTWADIEGRMYDGETFYQEALLPYIELTDKYGVGFMVNETTFFMYEEESFTPVPLNGYLDFYADAIDIFEKYDIGYALTFLGHSSIGIIGFERGLYSMWSEYPDYLGWETYTYDNGLSETFPVNNTLLNLIKEHIK